MIQGSLSEHLGERTVVLGVSGSVAAVEAPRLARELRRHGAVVKPVATRSALELVGEPALEWACDEPVVTELGGGAEHIELSDRDLLLLAPATANTVAKLASGIADNALTSVAAAFPPERTVVAPAMHLELYESDTFRRNIENLERSGVRVLRPRVGEGAAKLQPRREMVSYAKRMLRKGDLEGKRVVVTGGATAEPVDDIRIVTTRASGKTGVALAREAYERGAGVTLVLGRGTAEPPRWVDTVRVETAEEMTEASMEALEEADVLISSAAISDCSLEPHDGKLPGDEPIAIEMDPVRKLIDQARAAYPDLDIVAYKAESRVDDEELLESAEQKLAEGADLVVANDVAREDAGFESDDNEVLIVDGGSEKVRAPKTEIAEMVLDHFA